MSIGGGKKTSTTDQTQNTDMTGSQDSNSTTSDFSSQLQQMLSNMFSSGTNTGSNTGSVTRNPFGDSLAYLQKAMGGLDSANSSALPGLTDAKQSGLDYANSVFGGPSALNNTDLTETLKSIMGGGGAGLGTGLGGDASEALKRMLSGTPDYEGVRGAIDAANAPILRQLNEDIIPGLNSRATFLNNPTGGIKTLNRVLPDVTERMSTNATALMDAERQRALGAQQTGLGLFGQEADRALNAANMAPNLLSLGLMPSQLQEALAG